MVSSVIEVLDAENVDRAHIIGHSLGGLVGARLTADNPSRVASLALIAPAGLGEEVDREFIDGLATASSRRELKAALRLMFADERMVTRELVEEVLRYKRLEGVPEALTLLRDEILLNEGPTVFSLNSVVGQVPVLVLWGAEDRVLTGDHSEHVPKGARVEILESAGHSPHIEAAQDVNRLLTEFLTP
jgi:pyruvate dehydrogenase E2 component (dihydrolipoamide acetyltransferase)